MTNNRKKPTFKLILLALSMSLCASLTASSQTAAKKMKQTKTYAVAPGSFGGTGIIVTVEKTLVKIEYDCADGEISQQLKTDKKGYFMVEGSHKGPNVGPIRRDDQRKPDLVRYEGHITGKIMTLKVTNLKTGESLGEFILERGKSPVMHRCA